MIRRTFSPFHYEPPPEIDSFLVIGRLEGDDQLEVHDVQRRVGRSMPSRGPEKGLLCLLDRDGHELARATLGLEMMRIYPAMFDESGAINQQHAHREQLSGGFHATIPYVEGGVTLTIALEDTVVWRRDAPAYPPRIHSLKCELREQTGRLTWTDEVATDDHYKAVPLWHLRDDPRWQWLQAADRAAWIAAKASGTLTRGDFTFDIFELPVGEVFIHVEVSDGFHTTKSEPAIVTVPHRPMRIEIIPPMFVFQGETALMATARTHSTGVIDDESAYTWCLDGVECGRGMRPRIDPPDEGQHQVTVTVRWKGEEGVATADFAWPWRGTP